MSHLSKALLDMGAAIEYIDFSKLNLLDIGSSIQLVGVVFQGKGNNFICPFPNESMAGYQFKIMVATAEQWDQIIRQTDLMETEILTAAKDGKLVKIMLRKSNRQIEQGIQWQVYRRDGYRCRHCGKDDVPLTVDHAPVPYEESGPSTADNLVSACRKCNREKSNMSYQTWLNSSYYHKVSKTLSDDVKALNLSLLEKIDSIARVNHLKSR